MIKTNGPLFKPWRQGKFLYNSCDLSLLLLWSIIILVLAQVLFSKASFITESPGSSQKFLPYFGIICICPFLFLIYRIIRTNSNPNNEKIPNLDPFYPICYIYKDQLDPKEIKDGAIAKLDYKCLKKSFIYNTNSALSISNKSYQLMYSIFTIVIFLFTSSAGAFKNTIAHRSSIFITILIQMILLLSIINFSSVLFSEFYYISLYYLYFFNGILVIIATLIMILMTFIYFRLIFLDI